MCGIEIKLLKLSKTLKQMMSINLVVCTEPYLQHLFTMDYVVYC